MLGEWSSSVGKTGEPISTELNLCKGEGLGCF